jgi:uncharacterized protein (UPF0276 family)
MAARSVEARIPAQCGIGLRAPHYRDVLEALPLVPWFEVHSENYFGAGGPPLHYLARIRERYPLSLHGIGMSLGSTDPVERGHLSKLKALIERIEPGLVSDHLSWSSFNGRYFNDLLPIPYTEEALDHVCSRVTQVQEFLECRILVENPSTYLAYVRSNIPEWEFLVALAQRTGCGILLDVNNVYVSAWNLGMNPQLYIDSIPARYVDEIHLAGFTRNSTAGGDILIDSHSRPVAEEVWPLYSRALQRFGERPSLVEWDAELPPLEVLIAQSQRAQSMLEDVRVVAA